MSALKHFLLFSLLISFAACGAKVEKQEKTSELLDYAEKTFNTIYEKYGVEDENLLRENYPFNDKYSASYLDQPSEHDAPNQFSYLWPYSGMFSAANALYGNTSNVRYLNELEKKILPGLEEYFDKGRQPYAYASYINRAALSDRFYDDNVWIGIDFVDLYMLTKNLAYLEKAKVVWDFVYSGHDEKLGGGIYWVEQNKGSKHTCSNAPATVFALKLYKATHDENYSTLAKELYTWTKANLQDKEDLLYFDNIKLDGSIDEKKYSYNSGQMLQAATILYQLTKEESYLKDAEGIAASCFDYFFHSFSDEKGGFRLFNRGDVWFMAVMTRGFLELYETNNDAKYVKSIYKSLQHSWTAMKDENELFGTDWEGKDTKKEKWLLTQAAMVEMYARFANLNLE